MTDFKIMKQFDEEVEDINDYLERLDHYFSSNKVNDVDKVSAFIAVMGPTMYHKIKMLLAPSKPEQATQKQLEQVLKNNYVKKKVLIAERYKFYKRDQLKNETVTNFVNELKRLATTCQFGTFIDDYLRDKFVCGIIDEKIRANLLRKENLTFENAYRYALSHEVPLPSNDKIMQPEVIIMEIKPQNKKDKHKSNEPNNETGEDLKDLHHSLDIKDELQPFELHEEFEAQQEVFDLKCEQKDQQEYSDKECIQKLNLRKRSKPRIEKKKFVCGYCTKGFIRNTHLQRHLRSHTGEKPFCCEICKSTFSRKDSLQQHMRIHFPDGKIKSTESFSCESCDQVFPQKKILIKHLNIHDRKKRFICEICSRFYSRKGHLERHFRTHTGEKPYSCEICHENFMRRESWQQHIQVHTGERIYSCELCGNSFLRKSSLRQHLRTHAAERPFPCTVCDKTFTRKSHLQRHTRTHTGEKSYECQLCDYRCAEKCNLLVHIRRHKAREIRLQKNEANIVQNI